MCIIPSEYLDSDGNGINDEMQQKLEEVSGKSMEGGNDVDYHLINMNERRFQVVSE
jgi:hypothetical protein